MDGFLYGGIWVVSQQRGGGVNGTADLCRVYCTAKKLSTSLSVNQSVGQDAVFSVNIMSTDRRVPASNEPKSTRN